MARNTTPLLGVITLCAALTLPVQPLALFNLLTVPLLIHYSTITTTANFLKFMIPILTASSALHSAPTILKLVPSFIEALLIQVAFSLLLATAIALPIAGDATLSKKLKLSGLTAAGDFGLVWAATWWAWEALSPVGRYGVPSSLPNFAPVALIVRATGPTGLDILTGCVSYQWYQLGSAIAYRLEPYLPITVDLITLDDDESGSSSSGEAGPSTSSASRDSPRPFRPMATVTRFASIGVLIAATLPWFPTPLSLSSPLSQVTPLTVGCVLSPNHQNTPDALIHETLRIANHASVVVWSESAIRVDSEAGRESVLNTVADQVVKNRGTLVAVGIESPTDEGKMKNELVMIGCDGVVGEYTKQHLFPESVFFDREGQVPPVWSLSVKRPRSIPESEWASRNVTASPLICLDAFHSSLLRTQSQSTPSILLIPAAFPTLDLGLVAIEQIRLLAISHNTPALVCSSAGPRTAFAAYVDAWGRVLHLQAGGTSATFTVPIAYTHKQRARTIWERLGPIGIWDIALLALFPAQAAKVFKAVLKMKGVPLPDVLRYAGERADHLRGTRTASQAAREGEFI